MCPKCSDDVQNNDFVSWSIRKKELLKQMDKLLMRIQEARNDKKSRKWYIHEKRFKTGD